MGLAAPKPCQPLSPATAGSRQLLRRRHTTRVKVIKAGQSLRAWLRPVHWQDELYRSANNGIAFQPYICEALLFTDVIAAGCRISDPPASIAVDTTAPGEALLIA